MKRQILFLLLLFLATMSLIAESLDRSQYSVIDPYDYKLSIDKVENGAIRNYISPVIFSMQSGTNFYFKSLDGSTSLTLKANQRFKPMNSNQQVTIY